MGDTVLCNCGHPGIEHGRDIAGICIHHEQCRCFGWRPLGSQGIEVPAGDRRSEGNHPTAAPAGPTTDQDLKQQAINAAADAIGQQADMVFTANDAARVAVEAAWDLLAEHNHLLRVEIADLQRRLGTADEDLESYSERVAGYQIELERIAMSRQPQERTTWPSALAYHRDQAAKYRMHEQAARDDGKDDLADYYEQAAKALQARSGTPDRRPRLRCRWLLVRLHKNAYQAGGLNHPQAAAARDLLIAADRMRDRWAEGDDAVKQQLWQDLHTKADALRAALDQAQSGSS